MSTSRSADDNGTNAESEQQLPERLFSVQTTAALLDGSVSSVRRLIADGVLEAVYVRGSLRVRERSYTALLKTGTRRRKPHGKK